ncbi:MAG: type II secretion system protein GspM [Burkholderiaceae bacterium]
MEKLRQFWLERAPRERMWLAAGGVFVALAAGFLIALEPAWKGMARLERSLPATRAASAELNAMLAQARGLRERPAVAVAAGDIRSAIDASTQRAGVKPARLQAAADGDLQLGFANVPYAAWSSWLAAAERELGVRAVSVKIKATRTPGHADIDLALRAPRQ